MSIKKPLGVFTLAMISISAILNVRGLPIMAAIGWQCIFFYSIAAVTFLIPSAIVCAKFAAKFPENGGLYTWVREAFGREAGSIAIWLEWINNVIVYPASLATIIATCAYLGFPALEHNRFVIFTLMLVILWGLILFNLMNIAITSWLNIIGALFGTLLPCALIILIGFIYVAHHHLLQLPSFSHHFIPDINNSSLAIFVGVLSSYGGMQIIAFHANNVKNPKRTYPLAITVATIIIISASMLASLAIAFIIPATKINFMNGLIEGVAAFLNQHHLYWLVPIFAGLIALGTLATMNAWVIGPARGLQNAATHGDMPIFLAQQNKNQMPVRILFIQGVIGTLLASFFLWMPTLKSAFWVLIALMSQFTLVVYIMMFAAAIKLIKVRFFSLLGMLSCVTGFYLGLFPPHQLNWVHSYTYILMMLTIDGLIIAVPIFYLLTKRRLKIN